MSPHAGKVLGAAFLLACLMSDVRPAMADAETCAVVEEPRDLPAIVDSAALDAGVPRWILSNLVYHESRWNPDKVCFNENGTTDLGLFQLNSRYIAYFAETYNGGVLFDPMDPEQAAPVAARYLADLYRRTGEWRLALAAYNCGLARTRTGRIPARTAQYVAQVMGEKDI